MSIHDPAALARWNGASKADRSKACKASGRVCRYCPPVLRTACIHASHYTAEELTRALAHLTPGSPDDPAPAPAPETPAPAPPPTPAGDALAPLRDLLLGDVVARLRAEVRADVESAIADARAGRSVFHVKVGDAQPPREIPGVAHPALKRVLLLLSAKQHVLLVGPAGCGKSFLAEQAAAALGRPFFFTSLSAGATEASLVGYQIPGDGGKVVYVPAPFVEALETGGLVFLDEIDAADPNVLLALNAALSSKRMSLPKRAGRPVAERHDDFLCIGAANTACQGADRRFVGRNQQDEAVLSRFRVGWVDMDYDDGIESAMVDAEVLAWGRKVRAHLKAERSTRSLDTRYLIGATAVKASGGAPSDWRYGLFAAWKDDERARVPKDLLP